MCQYERQDSTGDVYRIFPPESTDILLYRLSDTTSSWWDPVEDLNRFDSCVVREIFGRPRKVLYVGGYMPPDTSLMQQLLLVDSIGYYTAWLTGHIVGNLPGRLVEAWVGGVHHGSLTAVGRTLETLPAEPLLMQNYPNPFNPSTTIRYAVPHRSHVRLTVFSMLGQQVATLVDGEVEAGEYEVRFDASGLSSGAYLYWLQVGSFTQARAHCPSGV